MRYPAQYHTSKNLPWIITCASSSVSKRVVLPSLTLGDPMHFIQIKDLNSEGVTSWHDSSRLESGRLDSLSGERSLNRGQSQKLRLEA